MLRKTRFYFAFPLILFTTALFAAIRVGVIDVQPANVKLVDHAALNGLKLSVQTINAKGGVLGQPLELVVKQTVPNQAIVTLQALSHDPSIGMIVTLQDQPLAATLQTMPASTDKLFISTATPLAIKSGYYSLVPNNKAQAVAAAQYIYNQMHRTQALVLYPTAQPALAQIASDFSKAMLALKGRVRQSMSYQGDLLSADDLATISNKKFDVIYLAANTVAANRIIQQLRVASIPEPIMGSDTYDLMTLQKMDPKIANDIYFTTTGFFDVNFNSKAMAIFLENYQKMFGKKATNYNAAIGYDAITILAQAITQARSTQPSKVITTLNKLNHFSGLSSDYDFTASPSVKMVGVIKIIDSRSKLAAIVFPAVN